MKPGGKRLLSGLEQQSLRKQVVDAEDQLKFTQLQLAACREENERWSGSYNEMVARLQNTEQALRESEEIRQNQNVHMSSHEELLRQSELEKKTMLNQSVQVCGYITWLLILTLLSGYSKP